MAEAHVLCDRVGILDGGRIVAGGRVGDLLARHGTGASVQFRARRPLERTVLLALPGVTACGCDAGVWSLSTSSVGETVAALMGVVVSGNHELLELRVLRPTLEDAFLSLTGRRWQAPAGGEP
jgi:ABC-2 type transport system ATP-binding protein